MHSHFRSIRTLTLSFAVFCGAGAAEWTVASAQTGDSQPSAIRAEVKSIAEICRGDYQHLCSGVMPGGGRVLACLKRYASDLSPACAKGLPEAEALRAKVQSK